MMNVDFMDGFCCIMYIFWYISVCAVAFHHCGGVRYLRCLFKKNKSTLLNKFLFFWPRFVYQLFLYLLCAVVNMVL